VHSADEQNHRRRRAAPAEDDRVDRQLQASTHGVGQQLASRQAVEIELADPLDRLDFR
jgi:hypothetical protein